jgi:hypothetical protein
LPRHRGRDGLTPNVRGAFDVYKKYAQLDVVGCEDASYIARRNNPGLCPGDGWQLMARRGGRGAEGAVGPRGMKGERGARGEAAPTVNSWVVDVVHYRAVPLMSNGVPGAPLDLRPLFEKFCEEAVAPAADAAVTAALRDAARG